MAGSIDLSGVEEALLNVLRQRAQKAASKIADELTKEAALAIEDFYGSYSPAMYKRQGGLKGTYKRYYRNPHGKIYHGGVELMPGTGSYSSFISGESVGSDFVSALAVFNGMHGNIEALPFKVKTVPPRMTPSPYEKINTKKDIILMNIYDYLN